MLKEKSKKILIIGPFPDPLMGMALANAVLERNLKERGFVVDRINTSMYDFDENVGKFSLKKTLHFLKFNKYIGKVIKADIVYLTPGHTFFGIVKYSLIFEVCKLFRKHLVLHIHSNTLKFEYQKSSVWKQKLMYNFLQKVDAAIVLSPSLKDNMTNFIDESRIYPVTNFVEKKFIGTEQEVINKDFSSIKIIFLSNLMTQKGILLVFEALRILESKGISYKAKIAGNIDKTILDKINSYLKTLSHVSYIGVVEGEEKRKLLEWGNTFLFPSYLTEGLPISILEAMAKGNRIISTKHPALLDLFNENSIEYIPKKSSNAIVEKLEKTHHSEDCEIRLANYRFIIQNCSEEKFTDSVLNVMLETTQTLK